MTDFERIKLYFEKNWATIEHLKKYVEFSKITKEEFLLITKQSYEK